LADNYLAAMHSIPKKIINSALCHFDFQPGNIFYGTKTEDFYLLDFDLCEKFHPAVDLANFLSHFYVMSRYHFPKTMVENLILSFIKSEAIKSKNWRKDINIFKLRSVIDIAQITAASFKKPSDDSRKVFEKLDELIKICL
jgi:thiamine kinase-like enzyme